MLAMDDSVFGFNAGGAVSLTVHNSECLRANAGNVVWITVRYDIRYLQDVYHCTITQNVKPGDNRP